MNNLSVSIENSRPFAYSLMENSDFVFSTVPVNIITDYRKCLEQCPRVKAYLIKTLGIDERSFTTHNIGYCDTSVYENASFEGCITLPLAYDENMVELFGLIISSAQNDDEKLFFSPSLQPIFTLDAIENVAIKCDTPIDVITFNERGYKNTFCEFGGYLSEMTIDELKQMGTSTIVYFTHVLGANFDIEEASYIAQRYGIKLCEVNLPFLVRHLGEWDTFQWQLLDKRLTDSLALLGCRNERYQA